MDLFRHYSDFLNTIPDGAIVVTKQGQIKLVNSYAAEMFAYTPAELVGQSLDILIPSSLRDAHQRHTRNFFDKPKSRPMGEGLPLQFLGLRKDGRHFHVDITISPLTIEDQQFGWAHSAQQELASYRDLIHAVDEAMYAAKRSGKNTICNAADTVN